MAGTLTPTPYQTVLDDDGVAVSGAKIYTYEAGTTTNATTYTTSALSVANANPIVADSAGRYVAYLAAGANLRFIIKTSADVTIDDQDNIQSVPGASVNLDIEGTVGEAVTAGQVLYLSSGAEASPLTAGLWYLTDSDAAPTSTTAQTIGVAVSAIAINTSGTIRLAGLVTTAGAVVVGTTYYVAATPGALTSSAPSFSRQVGVAMTTSTLVLAATTAVAASIPNPISQDLLFTDATYDIGKSGATRPRDLFASRNAVLGGTLDVTGVTTLATVTATQVDVTAEGDLRLQDNTGGEYVGLDAPSAVSGSYTLTFPAAIGAVDQVLSINNTDGTLQWATPETGDITSVVAGAGMTGGGSSGDVTLNVIGTADKVTVSADAVTIASTYIGQTSITTLGTIGTGTWQGTAVAAAYGGTGQTSYTTGDLPYASGSTAISKLGIGTANKVLTSSGSAPQWSTQVVNAALPTNVDLGGTLDVTGATTLDSTLGVTGATVLNSTLGVGQASPDGTAHIETGSAGSITFQGASDDLIVENSTHGGITVATPAASEGSLMFLGPTTTDLGIIAYSQASPGFQFHVANAEKARLTSTGLGVGTASPQSVLDVTISGQAKTDTGGVYAYLGKSNEASNYASLQLFAMGGTAQADRKWKFQTVEAGVANAGSIILQESGGTVGIGTATAGSTLTVNGSVSKSSGSFRIDHPLPAKQDTHHLVHSFIEGPRADLIYRGTVTLVAGSASVDLDAAAGMTAGTWVLLCRDAQCFTSNETGWQHVRGAVTGSTLTIDCEESDCTDTVSWMVVASRKDQHMYDTEWTDEDGHVIVEPEKPAPDPE